MQIVSNDTGLLADLCVQTDATGRDHCVVALKGTFQTTAHGQLTPAGHQLPLTTVDLHEGEPGRSAVVLESDFPLFKPLTDLLVLGRAVAPAGRPVQEMLVSLEIAGRSKEVVVIGDRRWERALTGVVPSAPVPFVEMPLTFGRAFGGVDDSRGPEDVAVEEDNPVGVGLHVHRSEDELIGMPLPNLEDPACRVAGPCDRPRPVGFGVTGRAWRTRRRFAGTYDARWREEVCPLLPEDFDPRYHQCAPVDQQVPRLRGGEVIRTSGMSALGQVVYTIPTDRPPVQFHFDQSIIRCVAEIDTVILEPHLGRASLVWRASAPLGKRLVALRSVTVGSPPAAWGADGRIGTRRGKPLFAGIGHTVRWLRGLRARGGA